MATLFSSVGAVSVVVFYGGKDKGRCIQIRIDRDELGLSLPEPVPATLTESEVKTLINQLQAFLDRDYAHLEA